MDESELVSRSQKGDVQSFNQLVESYQRQVYNLALRMLSNAEAAEDATQETFIAAYRGISKFRGGNFRAWLFRIATNVCYDQLRSAQRRPTTSLDALTLNSEDLLSAPNESPDEYALRRELGREIGNALASLPADQRQAVILSDIQGFGYEEIAEATNSSLGTVKSRISRGRAHLRDYLRGRGELLPQRFRL